jgi:hypothetical protein
LAAAIAHEVDGPIGATIVDGWGMLRFVVAQIPDLEEVRLPLGRIVRNAKRAT